MGRPQFQQVITQVPNKTIKTYEYQQTSSIGQYGDISIPFYSPPNTISKVLAMYIYIGPYSGVSGDIHSLGIQPTGDNYSYSFLHVSSKYTDSIWMDNGVWRSATDAQYPSSESAVVNQLRNIFFTESIGLNLHYYLDTGLSGSHSITPEVNLVVEESEIK